jgi:hypothetical protein
VAPPDSDHCVEAVPRWCAIFGQYLQSLEWQNITSAVTIVQRRFKSLIFFGAERDAENKVGRARHAKHEYSGRPHLHGMNRQQTQAYACQTPLPQSLWLIIYAFQLQEGKSMPHVATASIMWEKMGTPFRSSELSSEGYSFSTLPTHVYDCQGTSFDIALTSTLCWITELDHTAAKWPPSFH